MPAIRRQSSDHSDEPYNPLFSGIKSYFKRVIGWFSNQQTEEEDGQQQTARDQSEFSSLSQLNNQAPFKFAQSIQFEPTSMGFQDTNLNHTSTTNTTTNNNNNSNINNTNVNDSSLLLNTSGSSSGTNGHASIFAPSVMKPVPVRRTSSSGSNTHDTIGIVKTFMRKRSSSDDDAESQSSSSAMDIDHVEHSAFSLFKPSSLTSHVENGGGSSSGAIDLNESIYPSIPSSSKMTTFRTPPSMPHTPVSADRRRSSLLSSRRSTPHPLASERMRMNAAEMRTPTSAASSSSSIMRRTTPTAGATPSSTFLSSRMNRSAMNSSVLSVGSMSGRSASSTRQAVDYLDPSCSHSETAKRILETLDQLSSPIVDLRRFSQTLYDDKVRDTRTLVDSAKKSKLSRESQFEEDEYERELSAHKRSSSKLSLSSSEQKRKRRQSQDLNESQDLEDVPPFMGLDTSALTPHKKRREMPAASTAAVQPSLVKRLPKTRKSLTPEPQREPKQKQPVVAVQKQQAPPSPEPQPKQKEPETQRQPEQPFEFSFTQQPAFQASPRKEITPIVKPIDTTSETKKPKKSASPYGRAGAKEADDQFYLEDQKNLAEMKEKESALSSAFSFSSSAASTNFSFDGFGTSEKKDEQHQETTTTTFAPPTTQPSTFSSGFSFEIPSKSSTSAQQEDEEEQAEPVKETKEPEPSPLAGFSFNSFNAPNDNKKTEAADTTEAPAMNGFSFGVQDKEKKDEVATSAITFASTTSSFTSSTTFSSSFGPSTGNDAFSAFSFGDKSSTTAPSPFEIKATEPEKAPEAPKTIEKEPDTTGFAVGNIDFSSISAQPLSFDTFGASSSDKTTTEQPSNLFQTSPPTPFSFGSTTEISKPAVIETPKSETTTAAPSEGFKFGGDTTSSATTAVPSSFGFGGTSSPFQASSEIKFGETSSSSSSASGGFTFGAAQDLATTPKDTGFSAPSSGFSFGLPQTTETKSETSMPLFGGISSGGFGSTTTTPSLQLPATPETTDSTSFSTGFAFDTNKSTPTTSAPSGGFAFGATTDLSTPSTGFSAPSQSNVFVFGGANAQTSQPTGGGFTFGGASSNSFNAPALNSMGDEQSSSFAAPQNQSNPFAGFGSSTNGFAASNQTGFAANNNPFQPAAAAGLSSPFPGQPAQSFAAPQASPFQMNQQPTAPQTGNPFSGQAFSGQAFSIPQANAFPAGNQPQLGQPGQPGPTRKYKVRKQPKR